MSYERMAIEAVSCAVSRNRFWEILSNLHLADNTQITEDRYYRVQVLFVKLNFNFKQYGSFVNHSVDESIIPYYGKHNPKQFIRGKPIRFRFKLLVHHLIWRIPPSCRTILWSKYWFARYWSGSGCRCCVGFDWKVWGKSRSTITFDNLFISFPNVRWAYWTWNWCTTVSMAPQ